MPACLSLCLFACPLSLVRFCGIVCSMSWLASRRWRLWLDCRPTDPENWSVFDMDCFKQIVRKKKLLAPSRSYRLEKKTLGLVLFQVLSINLDYYQHGIEGIITQTLSSAQLYAGALLSTISPLIRSNIIFCFIQSHFPSVPFLRWLIFRWNGVI